MKITETELPGVLIVEPPAFRDDRGVFTELWHGARYAELGIAGPFVQDNFSRSRRGVLRGLHLQSPNAQGKLVSALAGSVIDVAVDVRRGSPSFGRHVAVELTEDNRRQLWIPRGFAHGFCVLSDWASVFYKCDAPYAPHAEKTVRWNDPALGIAWPEQTPVLSPRDAVAPLLAEIADLPAFEPH